MVTGSGQPDSQNPAYRLTHRHLKVLLIIVASKGCCSYTTKFFKLHFLPDVQQLGVEHQSPCRTSDANRDAISKITGKSLRDLHLVDPSIKKITLVCCQSSGLVSPTTKDFGINKKVNIVTDSLLTIASCHLRISLSRSTHELPNRRLRFSTTTVTTHEQDHSRIPP